MITKFTVTGADDSIKPEELIRLSKLYPFVEWGILLSGKRYGTNRFPSKEWITQLFDISHSGELISLSGHLCGQYVRDILLDKHTADEDLGFLWEMFQRIQINTHGEPHPYYVKTFDRLKSETSKEFIFQYDNANVNLLVDAVCAGVKCSTLFDCSHGAGLLPEKWPTPFNVLKCGYAGGLSPDNLRSAVHNISGVAKGVEIWLDLETHVRSNNDELFDLAKVEKCLVIMADYISAK